MMDQELKADMKLKMKKFLKTNRFLSASYTVEAAYIMPLVLLLVFMIMSYAFIFHDSIISNVWAVQLVEEERMAVSYGKIPFESKIYLEGFNDNTGFSIAKTLVSENQDKHYGFLLVGKPEGAALSFSTDEVSAEIRLSMNGLKLYADNKGNYEENFLESKSIYTPQKYARITKNVYRFAKHALFK